MPPPRTFDNAAVFAWTSVPNEDAMREPVRRPQQEVVDSDCSICRLGVQGAQTAAGRLATSVSQLVPY